MTTPTPPQGETKPARSAVTSAILITTAVVGGLALLGVVASATFGLRMPTQWDAIEHIDGTTEYFDETAGADLYADAAGVTIIEIEAAASDFTLKFGDVEEAVLTVDHAIQGEPGRGWTLERDDNALVVERQTSRRTSDLCLFGCGNGIGDQTVTLTLPRELGEKRAVSLEVQVAAGRFTGAGSFDELSLELNAGALELTGDARTLDLEVNVGDATIELADVKEANASVTAGRSTLTLSGIAPSRVDLSAEMGNLTVQLPRDSYRVDAKAELGSIDNRLSVSKESPNEVHVRAEAAEIILKS